MNNDTATKLWAPAWADYMWLAKGEHSRIFPKIRTFIRDVEAAASGATHEQISKITCRIRKGLRLAERKKITYSILRVRTKQIKYAHRIDCGLRAVRNATMFVGAQSLKHGELSQIMRRCGSDKGSNRHNYTLFYEVLFRDEKESIARVFELGIGTNDPNMASSMGVNGIPGASLRGWREYFPNAFIFGGDVDKKIIFNEDRIKTGFVDQTSPESVTQIFEKLGGGFDLIIDDGLHTYEANRTFFEGAFRQLKKGGIFVIEDISINEIERYKAFLNCYDSVIFEIPYYLNHDDDNCIAIISKD